MTFTDRAFVRSHGRKPSPTTLGTWAFQASKSDYAYEADLYGDVIFVPSATLGEAKRRVRAQAAALGPIVAVLP